MSSADTNMSTDVRFVPKLREDAKSMLLSEVELPRVVSTEDVRLRSEPISWLASTESKVDDLDLYSWNTGALKEMTRPLPWSCLSGCARACCSSFQTLRVFRLTNFIRERRREVAFFLCFVFASASAFPRGVVLGCLGGVERSIEGRSVMLTKDSAITVVGVDIGEVGGVRR